MVFLNFFLIFLSLMFCSCTQDTGNQNLSVDLNSTVSLEMLWVEPGTFTMGKAGTREIENNVTITKGFYLGKYEITQAQYQAVMSSNYEKQAKPSHFKNNLNRPVETVNMPDVVKFIELLNKKEANNLPKGYQYGLPTDAEWEYECKQGLVRYFHGETKSVQAMPIGGLEMRLMRLLMLEVINQTPGVFMICMGMFGNGQLIGLHH